MTHPFYRPLPQGLPPAQQIVALSTALEVAVERIKEALNYPGYCINVQDFASLVKNDDWTKAAEQAILVATVKVSLPIPTNGCEQRSAVVYFPPETYTITRPLRIARRWIKVIGAGSWATKIVFAPKDRTDTPDSLDGGILVPPESRTLFLFRRSSECHPHNMLTGCELRGFAILGAGCIDPDTQRETWMAEPNKTAIHLVDVSQMAVEDVTVHTSFSGAKSIALRIQGRDSTSINRVGFTAARPIVIQRNPNAVPSDLDLEQYPDASPDSIFDADHFHFQDCYLITQNDEEYAISIHSGVIHALTFDGFQAWCAGRGGLLWDDHESPGYANQVVIRNVRLEKAFGAQPADCIEPKPENGWFAFIKPSRALIGLIIEGISGQGTTLPQQADKGDEYHSGDAWRIRNGIYLERVNQISIRHADFSGMRAPRWYDHDTLVFKAPPQAIRFGPSCSAITLENIYYAEGCITDTSQGTTVTVYHRLAWLPSHLISEDPHTNLPTHSSLAWAKLESGVLPGILQAPWHTGDARYGGAIQQGHVSQSRGDHSVDLVYGIDAETQRFSTPLSASRMVRVLNRQAVGGARFRIVYEMQPGNAHPQIAVWNEQIPLRTLASGEWCDVEFDGSQWVLTASGTL